MIFFLYIFWSYTKMHASAYSLHNRFTMVFELGSVLAANGVGDHFDSVEYTSKVLDGLEEKRKFCYNVLSTSTFSRYHLGRKSKTEKFFMDTNALWYIDGEWTHPDQARISINDIALLRGYSAFEAFRTYNRRPFHLKEHLERLYRSGALIDLEIPQTREEIAAIVHEIIARNAYRHAAVRILVTGGESEDGLLATGRSKLLVMITPLGERDLQRFAQGYYLITSRLQREVPEAKTANYTSAIRALKQAARCGADDILFVNEHDHVQEASRSNFFLFLGDTLVTPREGILIGITRNVILELAKGRFPIEERPVLLEELAQASEAFLTSSTKEILPVVRIDDLMIGDGKPGPRTTELEQRFIAMVESETQV
jgi:branched-chain amino acid aminotransferase